VGASRCLFGGARPVQATAVSATDGSGGLSFRCDSPRARLRQAHGEVISISKQVRKQASKRQASSQHRGSVACWT